MKKCLLKLTLLIFTFAIGTISAQMERKIATPFPGEETGGFTKKKNKTEKIQSIGSNVFLNGGNRLVALQNNDGGWDWPLDDGNPNNTSPLNTIGPIGKGLAQAYWYTGGAAMKTALQNTGNLLLSKTNNFSPSDGYLAYELDMIFGGTTYRDHVNTNFYGPLAAGTYNRNGLGTLYDTEDYVNLIRTARASSGIANLAAWDIGMGLVGAASCGAGLTAWIAGVKAEINELDGSAYYDVIGLAGALYGLAFVGEDFDPTAGEHAAATNIDDLAAILASYQIDNGGFAWNSDYVISGDDNETIQETAYSILALDKADRTTYRSNIGGAAYYMTTVQLGTGGWENYNGSGENNEITGEALWGIMIALEEVWVDASWAGSTPGDEVETGKFFDFNAFDNIQDGIDAVGNSTVYIAAGTYYETLNITTDGLKIIGANRTTVIIDPTGKATNNAGIYVNADNVSLETLTLRSTITSSLPRYGIKIGEKDGCKLEDLTVKDVYRSGIDALGSSNLTITFVTSQDNVGHGLSLVDCNNVHVTDITLSGNGWQNVSVATWGRYSTLGTSGIVFDGTNTFGDLFQLEEGDYNNPGVAPAGDAIITYSTNPADGADVTVQASDFGFALHGEQDDSPDQNRIWFFSTLANAAIVPGLGGGGHWTGDCMYIEDLVDPTKWYVTPGCSIKCAINAASSGDNIYVAAGTYVESGQILIDKDINIVGANPTTTIIKTDQNTGSSGDARGWFLVNSGIELNLSNVTLDGSGYLVYQGIRTTGKGEINNCIIKNIKYNESGPTYGGVAVAAFGGPDMNVNIYNCTFSEIGRVGVLYFGSGISGSEFKGNTYTGKGAGDWLDYALDISAGAQVLVENNYVSGNKGIASSDGSTSAGILVTTLYGGGTNAEFNDNEITDNTTGITVGYDGSDVSVVKARHNKIYGNVSYGVSSTIPLVDAKFNWWGDNCGPGPVGPGAGDNVTVNVDFDPWLGKEVYVDDDFDASTWGWQMWAFDKIQDGIDNTCGSTVNVAAGTYVESILIDKPINVLGATHGVCKNGYTVPAGYAWDPSVESIIKHPNPSGGYVTIVDIYDTDDVTFDGFVVEELAAVGNLNSSLLRVRAQTKEISNINVINCIIGPNTNTVSQDGKQGRMGLYLVNNPYNDDGIVNSSFSCNKIFDCKGNGDNVFLWSSYYAYGAPGPASMSFTVIENNEIYGSHRSGIESAGGYSGLTIRNNNIYGNSELPGDDPNFLKYGHGIQLIRGSSDKVSDPLTAYGPVNLTIEGNFIHDNSKNGIYMGPINNNYTIVDNVLQDNGWDGIMLDLLGQYWNDQFEPAPLPNQYAVLDGSNNISANYNSFINNGLNGVRVVGVPTNSFIFDAEYNWWQSADGPNDPTGTLEMPANSGATVAQMLNAVAEGTGVFNQNVSENVDYYPWIGNTWTDMALWLHPILAKRHGDPMLASWDDATFPAEDATMGKDARKPQYSSTGINGTNGVEFNTAYGNTLYGHSDIMESPYHAEITTDETDKWNPDVGGKTLFVVFKTGTSVDPDGGPDPAYYSDGRQVLYESGGPLSGFNIYIVNGKIAFGMWNRFEGKYLVYDPPTDNSIYPLNPMSTYIAMVNYDGTSFVAAIGESGGAHPKSTPVAFQGLTKDSEDKTGIGGACRTRFHDYSIGETYSDQFGGILGDVMLFDKSLTAAEMNEALAYLSDRYSMPSFTFPKKSDDFKLIENFNYDGMVQISSAWPNPFSKSTSFDVNMEESKMTTVELYNWLGDKVKTIHEGTLSKGIHNFKIDGNDLSSGVYMIRVTGENFTEVVKAVHIK